MIVGIGSDLCNIERIERWLERLGDKQSHFLLEQDLPEDASEEQRAFHHAALLEAQLVLLRLADHGAVHPFRVTPSDEVLDARHHPLFVYGMTQEESSRKRNAGGSGG